MVKILALLIVGIASWYGPGFEGQPTRNQEIYDSSALTFAANNLFGQEIPDGKPYLVCTSNPVRAWWPHLGGWFVLHDVKPKCVVARWTDTGDFGRCGFVADLSHGTFTRLVGNDKIGLIEVRIYHIEMVRTSCVGNKCDNPKWKWCRWLP